MADYLWIILAEVCKLKYSIKKLGGKIQALCMVFTLGEIWTLKLMGFFFQKHLMFCSLWSTFFGPHNARFQELPPPGPLTALSLILLVPPKIEEVPPIIKNFETPVYILYICIYIYIYIQCTTDTAVYYICKPSHWYQTSEM